MQEKGAALRRQSDFCGCDKSFLLLGVSFRTFLSVKFGDVSSFPYIL